MAVGLLSKTAGSHLKLVDQVLVGQVGKWLSASPQLVEHAAKCVDVCVGADDALIAQQLWRLRSEVVSARAAAAAAAASTRSAEELTIKGRVPRQRVAI